MSFFSAYVEDETAIPYCRLREELAGAEQAGARIAGVLRLGGDGRGRGRS